MPSGSVSVFLRAKRAEFRLYSNFYLIENEITRSECPFLKILPSATDLNSDLEGGVRALCQSIRQEMVLFFRRWQGQRERNSTSSSIIRKTRPDILFNGRLGGISAEFEFFRHGNTERTESPRLWFFTGIPVKFKLQTRSLASAQALKLSSVGRAISVTSWPHEEESLRLNKYD